MPTFQGVWIINRDIKSKPHRIPDDPGVIASYVARGWEVTDLPTDLESDDPELLAAAEKLLAEDPAKPAKTKKSAEAKSATEQEKE